MELNYAAYYQACRAAYGARLGTPSVYGLGIHPIRPDAPAPHDLVRLPREYAKLIATLAAAVAERIEGGHGLYRNCERQVSAFADQLDDFWGLPGLERLAEILVPQLEARVMGCYAVVNQINIIRSRPSAAAPVSSWLWHYDNNPAEAFKVLVYLTEVTAERGAFEYLEGPVPGTFQKIESSRHSPTELSPPRWPKSRVPEAMVRRWLAEGWQVRRLVGPPGTMVVFDNNCVHRATIPVSRYRDALILNVRPSAERVRPFVSRAHTGSWAFNAKAWHPGRLQIEPNPSAPLVGGRAGT